MDTHTCESCYLFFFLNMNGHVLVAGIQGRIHVGYTDTFLLCFMSKIQRSINLSNILKPFNTTDFWVRQHNSAGHNLTIE